MNRQIRLVGLGIIVLFVALFVQLNWLQVVHARALNANPLNGNAVVKEYTAKRGDIVSADGVTLATSIPTNDEFKYLRQYPTGALFSQITGYFSFIYGSDGAERSYDRVLTGSSSPFKLPTSLTQLRQLLANHDQSQSITLSVLDRLQKVAETSLAGREGSVVALDPRTGSILAMYSNPSFDPNLLSGHDLAKVQANYKALTAQPGAVLAPGAYRQRYFPGSTFKIITASAVYDHAPPLATKVYPTLAALPLPQTTNLLHNFGGETCGGQMLELFTVSCNTGFGQIGLDLGANPLYSEAVSFGFNQVTTHRPPLSGRLHLPPAIGLHPGPPRPGLFGHRPAERRVHATRDGHGRGRHRQRGDDHDPAHPRARDQLSESSGQHLSTKTLAAGDHAGHRRPSDAVDAVRRQRPTRDGNGGPHPRRGSCSQDRYRSDRDRQDQRLVRSVRPRSQPDDRGGGAPPQPAGGRRVPGRHPGRPHRQSYDRGLSGRRDRDMSGLRLRPTAPPTPRLRGPAQPDVHRTDPTKPPSPPRL